MHTVKKWIDSDSEHDCPHQKNYTTGCFFKHSTRPIYIFLSRTSYGCANNDCCDRSDNDRNNDRSKDRRSVMLLCCKNIFMGVQIKNLQSFGGKKNFHSALQNSTGNLLFHNHCV